MKLIATAHGETLHNLIENPSLNELMGGISNVTIGDEAAQARRAGKTVRESRSPPTFPIVIEMHSRNIYVVHRTKNSVERILSDLTPAVVIYSRDSESNDWRIEGADYTKDLLMSLHMRCTRSADDIASSAGNGKTSRTRRGVRRRQSKSKAGGKGVPG